MRRSSVLAPSTHGKATLNEPLPAKTSLELSTMATACTRYAQVLGPTGKTTLDQPMAE